MSEIEESLEEPEANMYNAKKPWHKPDGPPMQSSDSLFYENQATPQETPDQEQEAPTQRKTQENLKNVLKFVKFCSKL